MLRSTKGIETGRTPPTSAYPWIMGIMVMFASATAWAGTPEASLKTVTDFIVAHLKARLVPHPDHLILSLVASGLTLVWLLANKKVRHVIGRLGGFVLFGLAIDSAWGIWGTIWDLFATYIVIGLVLAIFSSTVRGILWSGVRFLTVGAVSGLWNLAAKVAKGEEPHIGWTILTAVSMAGLINGATLSNPDTSYLPSILSSVGGLVVVVWGLTHMVWTCLACGGRNKDWNMDEPKCSHCGAHNPRVDWACACGKAVNPFSVRACRKCGKANPHMDPATGRPKRPIKEEEEGKWRCSRGHWSVKDARFCTTCREPNAKGTWDCPKHRCQKGLAYDAMFCPACGTQKPIAGAAPQQGEMECPRCHNRVPSLPFCNKCGNALGGGNPPPGGAPPNPAPQGGAAGAPRDDDNYL